MWGYAWSAGADAHMGDAPEAGLHEIENVTAARDEKDLHDKVVERNPGVQEINVTRAKDKHVECLCLERNAWQGTVSVRPCIHVRRRTSA